MRFFLVLILALYLVGFGELVYPYLRIQDSFQNNAEARRILDRGFLDIAAPYPMISYRSWPAIHFLNATLGYVTGQGLSLRLMKVVLFLWGLTGIFIVWAFARRIRIPHASEFLAPALVASSLWTYGYYSPMTLGLLFYWLVLLLLVNPEGKQGESVSLLVILGSLVFVNPLTSLAVLVPLAAAFLSHGRRSRSALLAIILYSAALWAWYLYQTNQQLLTEALAAQRTQPFLSLKSLFDPTRYVAFGDAPQRAWARLAQLGYVALYGTFLAASLTSYPWRWLSDHQRRTALFLILSMVGLPFLAISFHSEIEQRVYWFGVVPAVGLILLTWRGRRGLLMLLVGCVVLLPTARYGQEAAWPQVLTSDLHGDEFLASHVSTPREVSIFTPGGIRFFFYNPEFFLTRFLWWGDMWRPGIPPQQVDLSPIGQVVYVAFSKQSHNAWKATWGTDIFGRWPATPEGQKAELIYDNAQYYRIYHNQPLERGLP